MLSETYLFFETAAFTWVVGGELIRGFSHLVNATSDDRHCAFSSQSSRQEKSDRESTNRSFFGHQRLECLVVADVGLWMGSPASHFLVDAIADRVKVRVLQCLMGRVPHVRIVDEQSL
jgi:hypothetical protein